MRETRPAPPRYAQPAPMQCDDAHTDTGTCTCTCTDTDTVIATTHATMYVCVPSTWCIFVCQSNRRHSLPLQDSRQHDELCGGRGGLPLDPRAPELRAGRLLHQGRLGESGRPDCLHPRRERCARCLPAAGLPAGCLPPAARCLLPAFCLLAARCPLNDEHSPFISSETGVPGDVYPLTVSHVSPR